jgi:hypothetical protein
LAHFGLLSRHRHHQTHIEALLEQVCEEPQLPRSDFLYDFSVEVLFVLALDCEELLPMRIFESLDRLQVKFMHCQQSNRFQDHLRLSQTVQLAHQLTNRSISVLQLSHFGSVKEIMKSE